jgi:hypothetical protein
MACTDVERLIAEVRDCFRYTVESIIRLAVRVRRLEELGVEVQARIESAAVPLLRRVAYGQLAPELLVSCQSNVGLLNKAGMLPLPDQRKIAANEPMKVMEIDGDHRMVPPFSMTWREVRQVFGKGAVRSDGEQIGLLREQASRRKRAPEKAPVMLDRKRGGIIVGDCFISASAMANYLADLSSRKRG